MNVRQVLATIRPSALANNFGLEVASLCFETNGNPTSLKVSHGGLARLVAKCFEAGVSEGTHPSPRDFPAALPPEDFHDVNDP